MQDEAKRGGPAFSQQMSDDVRPIHRSGERRELHDATNLEGPHAVSCRDDGVGWHRTVMREKKTIMAIAVHVRRSIRIVFVYALNWKVSASRNRVMYKRGIEEKRQCRSG